MDEWDGGTDATMTLVWGLCMRDSQWVRVSAGIADGWGNLRCMGV